MGLTRRNNNRNPWPEEAAGVYNNIDRLTNEIDRVLTRIWQDGLGGERNLYLLRDLLPMVQKAAARIINECDRYDVMKKGQRWPSWPGWSIRDIESVAAAIAQAAAKAEDAFHRQPPNLPLVRQMVREALDYPAMIRGKLYDGPPPESEAEPVPITWYEGLDDMDIFGPEEMG